MFYVSSYSLATYLFCHSKRVVVPLGLRIFVHTVIVVVLCYRCPTFVARSLFFPFHHLSCMLFPASVGFNSPPASPPAITCPTHSRIRVVVTWCNRFEAARVARCFTTRNFRSDVASSSSSHRAVVGRDRYPIVCRGNDDNSRRPDTTCEKSAKNYYRRRFRHVFPVV